MDHKYYVIPNTIIVWGIITSIFMFLLYGNIQLRSLFIGTITPFILIYPIYCFGGIGAGDIKLLCVISSMTGVKGGIWISIISLFITGGVGLIKIMKEIGCNKKYSCVMTQYRFHKTHFTNGILIAVVLHPIIGRLV